MSTASDDTGAQDEGPEFRALPHPGDVPGFCERLLEHLRAADGEELVFEGVEAEKVADFWMVGLGVYEPDADTPSTPAEIAAGASPTGRFGRLMAEWDAESHRAMVAEWGEPLTKEPTLVGPDHEPEGVLDYLLVAQEFANIELWDRGESFLGLLVDWAGEVGESRYRQILMVIPRAHVMNGVQALIGDEVTALPQLVHGEHPNELRRRAWILSSLFDQGEVRLRDTPISASRCSLQSVRGTTTVWTFADDGRALVLLFEPDSRFWRWIQDQGEAEGSGRGGFSEEQLVALDRLLDGVPDDLRACIAARGETASGGVAEQDLEFGLLGERAVPIITGAFWFDGETWHLTRGIVEMGFRTGLGVDDLGVATALRRPYRLGGALTPGVFGRDDDRGAVVEQVFAACPYPEQARPEGDARLGLGVPARANRGQIVDDLERVASAWWDRDGDEAEVGSEAFEIGGRRLADAGDPAVLFTALGRADAWTGDALQEWTGKLVSIMDERWGVAREYRVDDGAGRDRRTPLTRLMRGAGLRDGRLWWVHGHAVLLLAGAPDAGLDTDVEVMVSIARADTVRELLGDLYLPEVRWRARVLADAAWTAGEGEADRSARGLVAWDGPALAGSDLVPKASRGELRVGRFLWVWHFTHDGRGLLTAHEVGPGARRGAFDTVAALFDGVPRDLLSLVVDREADGLHPVVTREGAEAADGQAARILPDAEAVFFHNGFHWRASHGMLRRAREASLAEARAGAADEPGEEAAALTADPTPWLYSHDLGVPQLRWGLRIGGALTPGSIAGEMYGREVFRRPITVDEAESVFVRVGTAFEAALLGTLNGLLDVIAERPGYRNVLDAALSNLDRESRREIVLWLLGQELDASSQLSFLTPIGVLLENGTLDADDAVLLTRLRESGAQTGAGLLGAAGRHPIVQLWLRDAEEADLMALLDALLDPIDGEAAPPDLAAPVSPDGTTLRERLRAVASGHARTRDALLARLEAAVTPR